MNEWTPVSSGVFPTDDKEYPVNRRGLGVWYACYSNGTWYPVGDSGTLDDVTHWMDIKPPEVAHG